MMEMDFSSLQEYIRPADLDVDDDQEHKFLLTNTGKVFVAEQPWNRDQTLIHEKWVEQLRAEGKISPDETITGGYLKNIRGKLKFWGPSTSPIKGASEEELFKALRRSGAQVLSDRRRGNT